MLLILFYFQKSINLHELINSSLQTYWVMLDKHLNHIFNSLRLQMDISINNSSNTFSIMLSSSPIHETMLQGVWTILYGGYIDIII